MPPAPNIQVRLHPGRRCGKRVIGRRSRQHNQVDVVSSNSGILKRRARRLLRNIRGEFAIRRDVALRYTRALADPFVRSIDFFGEVVIRDDFLR